MWEVDSEDANAIVGRFDSVGVAVLHGALDEAFFDRLGVTLDALEGTSPDGFSALVVRARKVPGKMPAPLREKAKHVLGRHKQNLRGFCYVLGGSGLKATMVRTAMNAVLMSMPFDAKIFGDVPAAVRWIARLPEQPPDLVAHEAELRAAVERLM